MNSTHYSAAWTDSGFFFDCSHKHKTIAKADSCLPCAGGYVVAIEDDAMRSLTTEEEAEWQRVHYALRIDKPVQEWAAQPQNSQATAPEGERSRRKGETFVEFVLRLLDARGLDQHAEPFPRVNHDAIVPNMNITMELLRVRGELQVLGKNTAVKLLLAATKPSLNSRNGALKWR